MATIYEEWTILDESGNNALTFTSFIDIVYKNDGKVLSYPTEQGGFVNYNKVQSPLSLKVTLGRQGNHSEIDETLKALEYYKTNAVKLFVATPSSFYADMTLESYNYTRNRESGASMLTVELGLTEVKEVETQVMTNVITRPKNATSSNNTETGKIQTKDRSAARSIFDYYGGA